MNSAIIFCTGMAVGAAIVWAMKKKENEICYASVAKEETQPDNDADISCDEMPKEKPEQENQEDSGEYSEMVNKYEGATAENGFQRIHEVSEDIYEDIDDVYDKQELYLYEDGTLTDDNQESIDEDDIFRLLGKNPAEYFEGRDSDVLYVRNDEIMTDFRIVFLKDDYFGEDFE